MDWVPQQIENSDEHETPAVNEQQPVDDPQCDSRRGSAGAPPSLADLPADFPKEWLEVEPEQLMSDAGEETAEEAPADKVDISEVGPPELPKVDAREWKLEETLASHREWLESKSVSGRKADFCGAELEGAELISANLRYADLQDANLRSADLLLADLRDASLVRADLQDSCLVGANLEGANLEDAALASALGLVPRQIAGTNLRDASLPESLRKFEALAKFEAAAKVSTRYMVACIAASAVSCFIIWKTKDVQLISDAGLFAFAKRSAGLLPTAEFYLIAPVMLFILYGLAHYNLQQAWESVLELPAIFPDGSELGDGSPRLIMALARSYFRWLSAEAPSQRFIEKWVSLSLAYWVVPMTLLLYWARYLTRQEIHGTILHGLLILGAGAIALYSTTRPDRASESWLTHDENTSWFGLRWKRTNIAKALGCLAALLILLSFGTFAGVPRDRYRGEQYGAANIRRWVPTLFSLVGFDPFADLTEGAISTRPAGWNGSDDQVATVRGAQLNGAKFRYAQAYGAFLVNSHLWRADLRGAFLSQADARGADLGQANLRSAVLDQANFAKANLDRAALDDADLAQANFAGANLTYSTLVRASLPDTKFNGANLYGAQISDAKLVRADLEKVDLRNAYLDGADLTRADLQQAYLWSAKLPHADLENAQLGGAILIDADLTHANLRGAHFQSAVLNDANFEGSILDNADFRGALGVTARQVCSAQSHRWALFEEALQAQVDSQCGGGSPEAPPLTPTPIHQP